MSSFSLFPHHHQNHTIQFRKKKIQNTLSLLKLSKSFFYYCLYFPALGTFFPTQKNIHTHTQNSLKNNIRTRFAPTYRCTNASWGMRMILGHFGWSMTRNLWRGATCPVVGPENMSQIMQLRAWQANSLAHQARPRLHSHQVNCDCRRLHRSSSSKSQLMWWPLQMSQPVWPMLCLNSNWLAQSGHSKAY